MQSDSQYDSLSNPGNVTHYVYEYFFRYFLQLWRKKSLKLSAITCLSLQSSPLIVIVSGIKLGTLLFECFWNIALCLFRVVFITIKTSAVRNVAREDAHVNTYKKHVYALIWINMKFVDIVTCVFLI